MVGFEVTHAFSVLAFKLLIINHVVLCTSVNF